MECREIESARVVHRAAVILDGHHQRTRRRKQFGRGTANIAESLHRDARSGQRQSDASRGFTPGQKHAAPRSLDAAQ